MKLSLIFFVLLQTVYGGNYLKEAPTFLQSCHIHGKQDGNCLAQVMSNFFTHWKDGVPGLKSIGSIDPYHIKRIRLSQKTENIADIHVELTNVINYGLSKVKLSKTSINEKDYTFKFDIHLPKLNMESNYKVKGNILVLNLDGHGELKCDIGDLDYSVVAKMNLIKMDDEYFFDMMSVKSDVKKIGSFHIQFDNLFGGNKELEDSANHLFNESWREIFDIMRPAIIDTLDAVVLDRYKKIFRYIPARFVIDDLP